jgi:TatD DNase family protein
VPLEKIIVETDCPYLTPAPFKGQRNEPLYVAYVAEKIAKIKQITSEEVAEITTENAKNCFSL